jgi:hypothetical protein
MTTAAQISANRANAQKSTGPRTVEGKAIVARNAVKHGLLGEQVIVEGEDRPRFTQHRDGMLRALVPVGEVEVSLAERLIGLSWRLQRIERLQVQAFEALCAGPAEGPAGAEEELTLGRIVVQDFSEARVLDKLLMYERRIEHSLCRMLGELRKERLFQNLEARTMDEGQPQVLLERLMGKLQDGPSGALRLGRRPAGCEEPPAYDTWAEGAEEVASGDCRVSRGGPALETCHVPPAAPEGVPEGGAGLSHATERAGQAATNGPETPGPGCEARLVGEGSGTGLGVLNAELGSHRRCIAGGGPFRAGGPLPDVTSRVWGPAPGSGFSEVTPAPRPLTPGFLRQTNPISAGGDVGQVLSDAGVTNDASVEGPEKTKPIYDRISLEKSMA